MKLMHLSDLHLGKRVNGFSMLDDQRYILKQITDVVDAEQPDGVLIAGDVYDKPVPPAEAVQLLDDFLWQLASRGRQVFLISGNHDSPERVAFGGRLMGQSGIHVSPVYDGNVAPISLPDAWGEVHLYLLPFLKPSHVRRFFDEEDPENYTDALRIAIDHMQVDESRRNVLLTHQFVTGAVRSDSEEVSVGGTDNVDGAVFDCFDYVALGHIHRPQKVGRETVRYCGSPLKYSFSEAGHEKSVSIVELEEKGNIHVRTVPLRPCHDLREIRGTYMEVTSRSFYEGMARDDYFHITLTDETDVPNAIGKLRVIYPNLMKLDYDNARTRGSFQVEATVDVEHLSPMELFSRLYEKQNRQPMTGEQAAFMQGLIEKIWEDAQ